MSFAFSCSDFGFAMNIARTAVLALAVLSVTAGRPASAQTFQERWSPIPRADAAEKPLRDQDQTLLGINRHERSQQQVATPPDRSHSHARMAQQQPPAPVTQQRAHPRGVMIGKASFCAYAAGTTASGTPYHRDKLTAASRILLFGTRLRVTDLKTNKSVEVKVTDREPASRRHHCWTGVLAVHSPRPVLAAESVSSPRPVLAAESVSSPRPVLAAESVSSPRLTLAAESVSSPRPVLAAESVSSPRPETVNSGVDAAAPCQYSPCE
jgi:rare lipoprotein A